MDANTVKFVIWGIMAMLTVIAVPVYLLWSIRRYLREKNGPGTNTAPRSGAGIGNALQELDRLVTRPAVEYTVEAETPILKREDDRGGE